MSSTKDLKAEIAKLKAENKRLREQVKPPGKRTKTSHAVQPPPAAQPAVSSNETVISNQLQTAMVTTEASKQDNPRHFQELMKKVPEEVVGMKNFHLRISFRRGEKEEADMQIDIDLSDEQRKSKNALPIYDLRMSTTGDNLTPDWFSHGLVAVAYECVLKLAKASPNYEKDRGRVILHSTDLRQGRISTATVSIADLPDAVINTIEAVLQSSDEFQINKAMVCEVQILHERRGEGSRRNRMLFEVEDFFKTQTLVDPDWAIQLEWKLCMPVSILLAPVRQIDDQTGEVHTLDYLMLDDFNDRLCNAEYTKLAKCTLDNLKIMYGQHVQSYAHNMEVLYAKVKELKPDIGQMNSWVESDLKWVCQVLQVSIHVLSYEHGCSQVAVYGITRYPWRHMYIVHHDNHYYACARPHKLVAKSKLSGQWNSNSLPSHYCDFCKKTCVRRPAHRLICREVCCKKRMTLADFYKTKVLAQFQTQFADPFGSSRSNKGFAQGFVKIAVCATCNIIYGRIKFPKQLDLEPGMQADDYIGELEHNEKQVSWLHCKQNHRTYLHKYKQCTTCKAYIPFPTLWKERYQYMNEHLCFCQRKELKVGNGGEYWIWDTECLQKNIQEGVHELPPSLVCAVNMANPDLKLEFEGSDCIDQFMRHLINNPKIFQGTTWLAHNSSSFDVQHICRWAHQKGLTYDYVNSPGSTHSKQQVTILGLRFIDSCKFIGIPLAEFGKTFGLPMSKGDFPYKFAIEEHLDYEGPMPDAYDENDWFGLEVRGKGATLPEATAKKAEFEKWYDEERLKWYTEEEPDKPKWNFMQQYKEYCWKDCEVLRQGCVIYRNNFLHIDDDFTEDEGGWRPRPIDPFQYMTQPQFLQEWFLTGMPETQRIASVPRIPKLQYKQSHKALQWLLYQQDALRYLLSDDDFSIRTVYNHPSGREYLVGLPDTSCHPVDGYAKHQGIEYFFQYHGCYWHGCPRCYPDKKKELHPHKQVPYENLYNVTVELARKIQRAYPQATYVETWECDFDEQRLKEELTNEYEVPTVPSIGSVIKTDVMTDRDVFFGGRVEVFQPLAIADINKGEDIRYIDVVSHYPHICAFKRLCTGHPKRLLGREIRKSRLKPENPNRYFGFFRGYLIPDVNDIYGGMPKKGDSHQLVFSNEPGVYCGFLEELYERMEHGLVVQEMYEVLHFGNRSSEEGPFKQYIAYNFRDKMEASGWGDLVKDTPFEQVELDEDTKVQVCEFIYQENKQLCKPRVEKVEKNKGRRFMAKGAINCIWGKFVQKDIEVVRYNISDPEDYYEIMNDPRVDPESIQFEFLVNAMYQAQFKWKEDFVQRGSKINPYLGASVTGWARTILHQKLREVNAIYCDTDSVVYRHLPNTQVSEIGGGIGQWQNEYGGDMRIQRFYALGPKCYCLVFNQPDPSTGATYKIKAKGITMTLRNHNLITPDDFLDVLVKNFDATYPVQDMDTPSITLKHFHIALDHFNVTGQDCRANKPLIAIEAVKKLRATFTKRSPVRFYGNDIYPHEDLKRDIHKWFNAFHTIPYGFCSAFRTHEMVSEVVYAHWYHVLEEVKSIHTALEILQMPDEPIGMMVN